MATTALRGRQRLYDVVSPEVVRFFEERRLFHPVVNNRRKISPSTISPSCSSPSVCSGGPSCYPAPTHLVDGTNHFTSAAISKPCDFIEIPVFLESRETLEFVGFCPERAEYIWDLWSKIPMHDIHVFNFFDFAVDFIPDPGIRQTRTEAINEKDGWREYMDELGISTGLKIAILLPEYENVRFTASCEFWSIESVREAYRALESLAQQFEESVKFFQYPEHEKDGKFEGTTEQPSTNVSPVPEGSRTKLYRASTLERATRFYIHQTGEINEYHFATLRGDLSGTEPVTYWTPQKVVADIYAGYLKRRIPIAQIIVTEVEFSEELAASVDLEGHRLSNTHYLKYLEDVDVITSNILSLKDIEYREKDSWKEIQPSDLVRIKIDGEDRLGIQWAFKSEEAQLAFEEHCRGKVTQYNLDRLLTVASKTERSLPSATG
ncbi:hypothetical protein AOL_s00081g256 [Orbilia oligospora ATCC 24927]|uniref:Uncharacterized protein n=1 Tax=Arthrobotrys oligospora (strain ATCC 24927 / CBS 115.81 / DSM 1491) TaxID=756982 RepID=G1XFW3_ARTOA|nr:hypothetical protein AOL_s00081g256 [Orbilia oligospora ATCC 24927]EGX47929.1 hypothetical protein AOL_s00081g256 [Orbilia oligospora ATCC 24927]